MMTWNPLKYVYGSDPFCTSSDFALAESESSLTEALEQGSQPKGIPLFEGGRIKGVISGNSIYLSKSMVMVGNPYKPVFKGKLMMNNIQVVLSGRFTMHWSGKVLFSIWVILALLVAILVFAGTVSSSTSGGFQSFIFAAGIFVLFVICGLISVAWGKWLARKDKKHMESLILKALTRPHA